MIPERYAPTTYALFRIVAGFLFMCNGLQKTFGMFGGQAPPLPYSPQPNVHFMRTHWDTMIFFGSIHL